MQKITFGKGDYRVDLNQPNNRYIIEVLEPQAQDSFFAWNFFDAILQQKEHYSDYVFEDVAEELLKKNKNLRKAFDKKLANDKNFKDNPSQQLNFIYQQSQHYEKEHRRYPIYRLK